MLRAIKFYLLVCLCLLILPLNAFPVNLVVDSFNADSVPLPRGTPVAVAGINGGFVRACNTNIAFGLLNVDAPIGFQSQVTVGGIVTLSDWTSSAGSSLLVPGTFYFTSPTLGKITTTQTAGSQSVGIALSGNDLAVNIGYTNGPSGGGGPITLTGAVTGSGTTTIATLLASSITNQWRIDATNNDLAISNALYGILTSVSNSLWLSASNLVWQGTNGLGSAAFTLTSAYDAAGTAQSATNKLTIDATNTFIQITVAQALTNNFATISYVNTATNNFITTANAQALTNNFDTIVDVNAKTNLLDTIVDVTAKLTSATNNALALATNNDTLTSQNTTNTTRLVANLGPSFDASGAALSATNKLMIDATNTFIQITVAQALTNNFDTIVDVNAKTNLLDTIVDVTAKLVSATNNALALATNNDTLTSQNTTNTTRLAANLSGNFDALNAAQNATNTTRLAANLAGSFDSLNAAQNATNTANLVVNLTASFDASGAALGATNGLAQATTNRINSMGSSVTNGLGAAVTNWVVGFFVPLTGTNMTGALTNGNGIYGLSYLTNMQIAVQSANYSILLSDTLIPLNGARTATLPTAVGIPGREFTLWCATSGTNALLTTSSQTIDGFTKWTNLSQFSVVTVRSDGANWRVVNTKP